MAKETKTPKAPDVPNPGATEETAAAATTASEATATETAATEAKADQPAAAGKVIEKQTIKVLHVVSRRPEGFRRAGFAFGSERTRLVVDELTDEQVKQLKEEPMLVVTEATEEV